MERLWTSDVNISNGKIKYVTSIYTLKQINKKTKQNKTKQNKTNKQTNKQTKNKTNKKPHAMLVKCNTIAWSELHEILNFLPKTKTKQNKSKNKHTKHASFKSYF